ncbi:hypothetical protein HPB48_006170 [Haemaphysalis longicornis]|uniref:Uncharacterized protein n=1 Tax=Haemaphysalis longicornis TaxID=44386 RepID=A0A9J6GZX5_HAELO|nr:hypothetical protein HPB48_006170 [Haemaphysalis longicornis]
MGTIVKWWKIVNVKMPIKGARFRDDFKKPVFPSERDTKLSFLYDFLDWLEYCKKKQADTCKLAKETHGALHHTQTTQPLIDICRYCFDEVHMSFFLLGKFHTDLLEIGLKGTGGWLVSISRIHKAALRSGDQAAASKHTAPNRDVIRKDWK